MPSLEADNIAWRWSSKGVFYVHSFLSFEDINNTEFDSLWISKIPLKIKLFMQLVRKNRILTKDNLIKRGWIESDECFVNKNKVQIIYL